MDVAIDVADAVKNYIDAQQPNVPEGVELSYWDDDSQIVKNRISTLTTSAMQGGILVLALLSLFLRPSIAFWVFIGIPISFMGAFIAMPFFGITLNIMSLFGFILVLGIVVDDALFLREQTARNATQFVRMACCRKKANPHARKSEIVDRLGTQKNIPPIPGHEVGRHKT